MFLQKCIRIGALVLGIGACIVVYMVIKTVGVNIGTKPIVGAPCKLQTCHGLDIVCGASEPRMCTMQYQIGDKCLRYAQCGVQNGACGQIVTQAFQACKACVQNCMQAHQNDPQGVFACEAQCP